jgi:hypothetical protein
MRSERVALCIRKSRYLSFTSSGVRSIIYEWLYSPLFGPGRSFGFIILYTQRVGLLWRGISPSQDRYLHRKTRTQNKRKQISVPRVGFEPTTLAFERTKTVHALDRTCTVIGISWAIWPQKWNASEKIYFHTCKPVGGGQWSTNKLQPFKTDRVMHSGSVASPDISDNVFVCLLRLSEQTAIVSLNNISERSFMVMNAFFFVKQGLNIKKKYCLEIMESRTGYSGQRDEWNSSASRTST